MQQLLAIVKYLRGAMQLVIFRCTAFASSYFSGPWWTVPVRKNIQVLLGKSPPCFQKMCLKPCFSEHSGYSSRQHCHQDAHKAFFAPATFCCPLGSHTSQVLCGSSSDIGRYHPSMCSQVFHPTLEYLLCFCCILTLWVLLRLICLHRRV